MLESRQEGSRGGHKPPSRGWQACDLLVYFLAELFAPMLVILSRKNDKKVSSDSENFHFLHKKQHHGNSAENNVSPG